MRKAVLRLLGGGVALAAFCVPALAQQSDVLSACRTEVQSVTLRMTFPVGACVEPMDTWAAPSANGIAAVTVSTREELNDFCTTQLVAEHFDHSVVVDPAATSIEVTVLSPDNSTLLSGVVQINPSCSGRPPVVVE